MCGVANAMSRAAGQWGHQKILCVAVQSATCHVQSSWTMGPPIKDSVKEKISISHQRPRGKRSDEAPQAGGFKRKMCGVANVTCHVQSSWTVSGATNEFFVWRCKRNMPCSEQLESGATNA
jgi:hypothetical protein